MDIQREMSTLSLSKGSSLIPLCPISIEIPLR